MLICLEQGLRRLDCARVNMLWESLARRDSSERSTRTRTNKRQLQIEHCSSMTKWTHRERKWYTQPEMESRCQIILFAILSLWCVTRNFNIRILLHIRYYNTGKCSIISLKIVEKTSRNSKRIPRPSTHKLYRYHQNRESSFFSIWDYFHIFCSVDRSRLSKETKNRGPKSILKLYPLVKISIFLSD